MVSTADSTPLLSSASISSVSGSVLHISLHRPLQPHPNSCLLLFLPNSTSIKIESSDWLSFQSLIQKLYASSSPGKNLFTELLAQRLTRVCLAALSRIALRAGRRADSSLLQRLPNQTRSRRLLEVESAGVPFLHQIAPYAFQRAEHCRGAAPLDLLAFAEGAERGHLFKARRSHRLAARFLLRVEIPELSQADPQSDGSLHRLPSRRSQLLLELRSVSSRHADHLLEWLQLQPVSRYLVSAVRRAESLLHEHRQAARGERHSRRDRGHFACGKQSDHRRGESKRRVGLLFLVFDAFVPHCGQADRVVQARLFRDSEREAPGKLPCSLRQARF